MELQGDVTLSAEDLSFPTAHGTALKDAVPLPVDHQTTYSDGDDDADYDEYDEEEEPHHSWLGGSTAVKFLLAGGIAGAGTKQLCAVLELVLMASSIANMHGPIRQVKNLFDNATTRAGRYAYRS